MIIRNHIIDFKKSQLLHSNLVNKKQRLKDDVTFRTEQLNKKTKNLQTMLDNLSEGLLIINIGSCIQQEYSLFLEDLLGEDKLAGKPAIDVLFKNSNLSSNDIANAKLVLNSSLDKPLAQFEHNKHLLVSQYSIKTTESEKHVHIHWTPICNNEGYIKQILVSLYDRSLIKSLIQDNEKHTRELQLIGEVLMIDQQQVFSELMNTSYLAIKKIHNLAKFSNNNDPEILETILQTLHKTKDNVWEHGLIYFTRKLQDVAIYINNAKKDVNSLSNFQNLSPQISLLQEVVEEYNTLNLKLGRANITSTKDELYIDKKSLQQMLNQFSESENYTDEETIKALMKAKAYISSLAAQSLNGISNDCP